jgi:sulfite exporter TauE/SafE
MFSLIAPFAVGFIGSLHCLGMCGPLVLAYSLHLNSAANPERIMKPSAWQRGILHHLTFHIGRLLTYGFLGSLAAGLVQLANFNQIFFNLRGTVTLLGGILMMLAGLVLLKIIPLPFSLTTLSNGLGPLGSRLLPLLFQSQRIGSKMVLGMATGFLPCMLSWSMIIMAATTKDFLWGFLTMTSFGLGTVPALFFTGLFASMLSLKVRLIGERVAALSIILMGLILAFKGVKFFV